MFWISLALALAIALVHLVVRAHWVSKLMESGWITSGSGGLAVAYVFIHLLPELGEHQDVLEKHKSQAAFLEYLEHYAYIVALAGLILYFGIEHLAQKSKARRSEGQESSLLVFWLHIGSFLIFNSIIGYLLVHRIHTKTPWNLILFGVAMGMHFLVVDHTLSQHHEKKYDHFGRWILSGAVLVGWCTGKWFPIPEAAFALLFAFLSGATIINVLKEELPQEKRNHFWAFLLGASVYTLLLLLSH